VPSSASHLTRYWFTVAGSPHVTHFSPLGYGVTAFGYEDAVDVLSRRIWTGDGPLPITSHVEGVDVSTLDAKHVLLNVGDVTRRGIWFPSGLV